MKTNTSRRRILRQRVWLLSLVLLAAVFVELGLGGVLASRCGQAVALRTDEVPPPNLSLADVLPALR